MHPAQVVLRQRVALIGALAVPAQRLGLVPGHAAPVLVHDPQAALPAWIVELGGLPEPDHGLGVVPGRGQRARVLGHVAGIGRRQGDGLLARGDGALPVDGLAPHVAGTRLGRIADSGQLVALTQGSRLRRRTRRRKRRRDRRRRRGRRGGGRARRRREVEVAHQRGGLPGNLVVPRLSGHRDPHALEDVLDLQARGRHRSHQLPGVQPAPPVPIARHLPGGGGVGDQGTHGRLDRRQPPAAAPGAPLEGIVAARVEDDQVERVLPDLVEDRIHVHGLEPDVGLALDHRIDGDQVVLAAELQAVSRVVEQGGAARHDLPPELRHRPQHLLLGQVLAQQHVEAEAPEGARHRPRVVHGVPERGVGVGVVADDEPDARRRGLGERRRGEGGDEDAGEAETEQSTPVAPAGDALGLPSPVPSESSHGRSRSAWTVGRPRHGVKPSSGALGLAGPAGHGPLKLHGTRVFRVSKHSARARSALVADLVRIGAPAARGRRGARLTRGARSAGRLRTRGWSAGHHGPRRPRAAASGLSEGRGTAGRSPS